MFDWSVVVIGLNEEKRIGACIRSVARAVQNKSAHVSVILNGTTDNSRAEVLRAAEACPWLNLSIYETPLADKSNALNKFIHELRPQSKYCFFVDAYVTVEANAFSHLANALDADPYKNGASAVRGNGEEALNKAILKGEAFVGGCNAVRASFLDRMVKGAVFLPVGYYRGDGLIHALLDTDLECQNQRDPHRVVGVATAKYFAPKQSMFRVADVQRQAARMVRQMRGRIENAAIKEYRNTHHTFGDLPLNAATLLRGWLSRNELKVSSLKDRVLLRHAIRQIDRLPVHSVLCEMRLTYATPVIHPPAVEVAQPSEPALV